MCVNDPGEIFQNLLKMKSNSMFYSIEKSNLSSNILYKWTLNFLIIYIGTLEKPFKVLQYASSEFRRNYVPSWVLFRNWGLKGVCLRIWWGKCYIRWIVKVNFFCIYWININFLLCLFMSIWNKTFKEKYWKLRFLIFPFCVILKLGGY